MEECVICWTETLWRIGPCGHAMCETCTANWCSKNPTCPYCRSDTFGLCEWVPPLTAVRPAGSNERARLVKRICLPGDTHPGITVSSCKNGVCVRSVNRNDRCALHGVRQGMVIETFNGVPCSDHRIVIRMFDTARQYRHDAVITLRRRRKKQTESDVIVRPRPAVFSRTCCWFGILRQVGWRRRGDQYVASPPSRNGE